MLNQITGTDFELSSDLSYEVFDDNGWTKRQAQICSHDGLSYLSLHALGLHGRDMEDVAATSVVTSWIAALQAS